MKKTKKVITIKHKIILTKNGFNEDFIYDYVNNNIVNKKSKYYEDMGRIRNLMKNQNETGYNYNIGTLIYFIKENNIEYYEDNIESYLKEL